MKETYYRMENKPPEILQAKLVIENSEPVIHVLPDRNNYVNFLIQRNRLHKAMWTVIWLVLIVSAVVIYVRKGV